MPRTKQATRRHSNEATPEEKKERKRAKKQRRNLKKKEERELQVNWVIDRIGVLSHKEKEEKEEEQPQFKKQHELEEQELKEERELRDECYNFDLYHRDVTYYGGACLTSKYEIAEYENM